MTMRLSCLLLLAALTMSAGCVDLTTSIIRTGTVKSELPPEIDPNLPQQTAQTNGGDQPQPPDKSRPSGLHRAMNSTGAGLALSGPVTADQISESNYRQMAEALGREMDADDAR